MHCDNAPARARAQHTCNICHIIIKSYKSLVRQRRRRARGKLLCVCVGAVVWDGKKSKKINLKLKVCLMNARVFGRQNVLHLRNVQAGSKAIYVCKDILSIFLYVHDCSTVFFCLKCLSAAERSNGKCLANCCWRITASD